MQQGCLQGHEFFRVCMRLEFNDHFTKFTKKKLIGEVLQIKVSDALESPFRKRQKKNSLGISDIMSSSNFCVLKEFSITTTITVSIIMFIGVVFQFKVTDMLMTKKKLYKVSL